MALVVDGAIVIVDQGRLVCDDARGLDDAGRDICEITQ
jgi:hypothetical protein